MVGLQVASSPTIFCFYYHPVRDELLGRKKW